MLHFFMASLSLLRTTAPGAAGPVASRPFAPMAPGAAATVARRAPCTTMQFGRGVPPEIAAALTPAAGDPNAWTTKDVTEIWTAFERVYGNREKALAAARKNTQVLLPFLNDGRNIAGAYAVLVEVLGATVAAEVVEKNPGVLACSASSLKETSPQSIVNAANAVAFIDSIPIEVLKPLRASIFPIFAALLGARIVQCGDGACNEGAKAWGGIGPELTRFISENFS
jgi:hypothetical protein